MRSVPGTGSEGRSPKIVGSRGRMYSTSSELADDSATDDGDEEVEVVDAMRKNDKEECRAT